MVRVLSLLCLRTVGAVLWSSTEQDCLFLMPPARYGESHREKKLWDDGKQWSVLDQGKLEQILSMLTTTASNEFPLGRCRDVGQTTHKCDEKTPKGKATRSDHDLCKTPNSELYWPETMKDFFTSGGVLKKIVFHRTHVTHGLIGTFEYTVSRVVRLGGGKQRYNEVKRDHLFLRTGENTWVPYIESCGDVGWDCSAEGLANLVKNNLRALTAVDSHSGASIYAHGFLDDEMYFHVWNDHAPTRKEPKCHRFKYTTRHPLTGIAPQWQRDQQDVELFPCAWDQGYKAYEE